MNDRTTEEGCGPMRAENPVPYTVGKEMEFAMRNALDQGWASKMSLYRFRSHAAATAAGIALGLFALTAAWGADATNESAKEGSYTGRIESIDLKARTVKVQNETSSKSFQVPKDARIATGENEEASLSDLKIGQTIQVNYTEGNNEAEAHRLTTKRSRKGGRQERAEVWIF